MATTCASSTYVSACHSSRLPAHILIRRFAFFRRPSSVMRSSPLTRGTTLQSALVTTSRRKQCVSSFSTWLRRERPTSTRPGRRGKQKPLQRGTWTTRNTTRRYVLAFRVCLPMPWRGAWWPNIYVHWFNSLSHSYRVYSQDTLKGYVKGIRSHAVEMGIRGDKCRWPLTRDIINRYAQWASRLRKEYVTNSSFSQLFKAICSSKPNSFSSVKLASIFV